MKITLILLFLLSVFSHISAATLNTYENRESAMSTLDIEHGRQLVAKLQDQLKQQNPAQSRFILDEFSRQPELSIIDIEYALLRLAEDARMIDTKLDPAVLDYLVTYKSRAQLVHPESIHATTPVFNIRAAAAGASVLQQREFALKTASGMSQQPEALLQHYLSVSIVSQKAIRDAVQKLAPNQQQQLLQASLRRLKDSPTYSPAVTDLCATLALNLEDATALSSIVIKASGRQLSQLLQQADASLPNEQYLALLYQSVHSSPENAAIAIHYLGKLSSIDSKIYSDLLGWLAEPRVSAATALALSASKHPQVHADLLRLTASPHPTTARNARLALELIAENGMEDQL